LGAVALEQAKQRGVRKVIAPIYTSEKAARADEGRRVYAVAQVDRAKRKLSVDL
jgi:hypothetical protein